MLHHAPGAMRHAPSKALLTQPPLHLLHPLTMILAHALILKAIMIKT